MRRETLVHVSFFLGGNRGAEKMSRTMNGNGSAPSPAAQPRHVMATACGRDQRGDPDFEGFSNV